MTATVHKFRAGPLPSVDTRASCRESYAHLKMVEAAEARDAVTRWAGDPGDEMQGSGGSGPVVLITLCVLMPMALWGVVAAVRHLLGAV